MTDVMTPAVACPQASLSDPISILTVEDSIKRAFKNARIRTIANVLNIPVHHWIRDHGLNYRQVERLVDELRRHGRRLGDHSDPR